MTPSTIEIPATPRFERAGNGEFYHWNYQKLVRVTHVVNMFTGNHLPMWYAQMTADECADIVAKKDRGELGQAEADYLICDTATRKTAAIRYRDEKGAIGSLMHHATHEKLLGVAAFPQKELVDYLADMAIRLGSANPDKDEPGHEPYAMTLAKKARHYVVALSDWWDRAEMEVEGIGLEAMIVSEDRSYAGTADVFTRSIRTSWLRRELGKDFPPQWNDYGEVSLCGDYKSSNELNLPKIKMQIAAYTNADFIGLTSIEGREGDKEKIPNTHGCFALHVRPVDGVKMVAWDHDPEDWEAFLSLRHAYGHLYESPMNKPRKRSKQAPQKDENGRKKVPF